MNLLKEGILQQAVVKTTLTRKLTVDGLTKPYPVYKVRLDWLFYNDQNDRIATWISQYKAQHDGKAPNSSDKEAYNAIIEQFIVESNPDAIRKTQKWLTSVNPALFLQMAELLTATAVSLVCGGWLQRMIVSAILKP